MGLPVAWPQFGQTSFMEYRPHARHFCRIDRIPSVLPMELPFAALRGQGLDHAGGRLLDLLFRVLVVRRAHDEAVFRRPDVLDLHGDAVRLHRGLRERLLDVDRPVRTEVHRLDVAIDRHMGRDDVLPRDLDERLDPGTLEVLVLEGGLVHDALLERPVEGAEGIEQVVSELLPTFVDGLAEALRDDREEVLRLLLVLPFLDLLAALVLVDGLEGEVDVALLLVRLEDLADDLLALADVGAHVLDPPGADLRDVDEALLNLVLVQGDERAEVLHVRHGADDQVALVGPVVASRGCRAAGGPCGIPDTGTADGSSSSASRGPRASVGESHRTPRSPVETGAGPPAVRTAGGS